MTAVGLEPTAHHLKGDCSTTELRGHVLSSILANLLTNLTTSAQR